MLSDWDILAGQEPLVIPVPGVPRLVYEPTDDIVCDQTGFLLSSYQLVDAEALICF